MSHVVIPWVEPSVDAMQTMVEDAKIAAKTLDELRNINPSLEELQLLSQLEPQGDQRVRDTWGTLQVHLAQLDQLLLLHSEVRFKLSDFNSCIERNEGAKIVFEERQAAEESNLRRQEVELKCLDTEKDSNIETILKPLIDRLHLPPGAEGYIEASQDVKEAIVKKEFRVKYQSDMQKDQDKLLIKRNITEQNVKDAKAAKKRHTEDEERRQLNHKSDLHRRRIAGIKMVQQRVLAAPSSLHALAAHRLCKANVTGLRHYATDQRLTVLIDGQWHDVRVVNPPPAGQIEHEVQGRSVDGAAKPQSATSNLRSGLLYGPSAWLCSVKLHPFNHSPHELDASAFHSLWRKHAQARALAPSIHRHLLLALLVAPSTFAHTPLAPYAGDAPEAFKYRRRTLWPSAERVGSGGGDQDRKRTLV